MCRAESAAVQELVSTFIAILSFFVGYFVLRRFLASVGPERRNVHDGNGGDTGTDSHNSTASSRKKKHKQVVTMAGEILCSGSSHDLSHGIPQSNLLDIVKKLCPKKSCELYILMRVENDQEQEIFLKALKQANFLELVPEHRVLFHSTELGRKDIVRQIEPDLHYESSRVVCSELQRFMRRIVFVGEGSFASHVYVVDSLITWYAAATE